MRNTFTKKQTGLAKACALALGVLSATASAQVPSDEKALHEAAAKGADLAKLAPLLMIYSGAARAQKE